MTRRQVRISLDEALWDAVQAAAKVRGVAPHLYVEEALSASLGPSDAMQRFAHVAESMNVNAADIMANAAETRDQIRVISDFIVDLYRVRNENELVDN
ncbi:hypothetical protein MKK75_00905 [Methylobacterium sp. J-030]|uniref:hypothetical protein n=1 Tax=Methylobacterium sp. J-030 TaxID=2836627 RepID=UPI001FB8ABBB|nr:hypothetical protein [Methylobacterium sp. J-030]MCJ2067374.1 hypothetical protein [Methylobacterium sp. J-030]